MYSRSYYADEAGRVTLPDNYDGTAFIDHKSSEENGREIFTESPTENVTEASCQNNGIFHGLSKSPILSSIFGSFNRFGGLRMPNIGVEEILILATAAFLFFSKDGDKECAIILLLLLLVN